MAGMSRNTVGGVSSWIGVVVLLLGLSGLVIGLGWRARQMPVGSEGPLSASDPQPNIVLIFTDQHRFDALGVVGHPIAVTPSMDALANEGVLFRRGYSNSPVCAPARVALMTGLLPHQTGVTSNSHETRPQGPSHVRRIRDEAGYATALVGKAHLYAGERHTREGAEILEAWGFEHTVEVPGPMEHTVRGSAYSDYLTATTPEGETDKAERYIDYLRTHPYYGPPMQEEPWRLPEEDHMDVFIGRHAREWILAHEDERPFYLQVNFGGPHSPFNAPQAYHDLYDREDPAFPSRNAAPPDPPVSPLVTRMLEKRSAPWTDAEYRSVVVDYLARVSLVDAQIGALLDTLRETGQYDNTWIIYASDHGEMLGDHDLIKKVVFFEASWRIPLIIRPPGGTEPWETIALSDTVDLSASLLEMAGLEVPAGVPGVSQVPRVRAGPNAPQAQVGKGWIYGENKESFAIRTDRWKLVYDVKRAAPVELYDLIDDPEETDNRVDEPHLSEVREALEAQLLGIRDQYPAAGGH
jgi:choline-sulfatase